MFFGGEQYNYYYYTTSNKMGNRVEASIKHSFSKEEKGGFPYLCEIRRKGVKPNKQFDLHSYYLQHCDKEEKAEISSISASQEEKEPIFTATIADCKGLFQEGPSEITTPEKYPYSAVGMVLSKTKHCKIIGTGCLIGPNIVLTCAHNLYDTKSRQWYDDIEFIPSVIQKQTRTGYKIKNAFIPQKYMKSDRDKPAKYNEGCLYDYAVLVLDTEDNLEEYFGSFGYDFDWQSSESYEKMMHKKNVIEEITLVGYRISHNHCGIEFDAYKGSAFCSSNFLVYTINTYYGLSGAPIFIYDGQEESILAIHQRDITDILDESKVKHKAGLKLRFKMFEEINQNFRSAVCHYDFSHQNIQHQYLSSFLKKIELKQDQKLNERCLSLNFINNLIGDSGCENLSKAKLSSLHHLSLWGNRITESGCHFLAQGGWNYIRSLSLKNNIIGEQGIHLIAGANWPYLESLDLWDCRIGDKGCEHLSKAQWHYLRSLNLRNNNISEGCGYLIKAPWDLLKDLNLRANKIQEGGCLSLSKSKWKHLFFLNLRNNFINYQGCLYLSQADWPEIDAIDLMDNKGVGMWGAEEFKGKKVKIYWNKEHKEA